jgi:hypothetical protein
MTTANNQPLYLQEIQGSMSCNYSIEKYLVEKHTPKHLTIFSARVLEGYGCAINIL